MHPHAKPIVRIAVGHLVRCVLAGAVATVACGAVPASAAVLNADRVGGREVGRDVELRTAAPSLSIPSGILVSDDGTVLWERFADARRSPASITKMMTAVVVLRHGGFREEVTVPAAATAIGESSAGIQAGEVLTVRELLSAMLVKSANEAARALAIHVSGSERAFVREMNAAAGELGLSRTSFNNSHGLDRPGHLTTARDLASLTSYAMSFPAFRHDVALRHATISSPWGERELENSNKLLWRMKGVDGVKTGWTDKAGYCLVSSVKRGGIGMYGVVLGAATEESRFDQSRKLLRWGLAHYQRKTLVAKGTSAREFKPVTVVDWLDVKVKSVAETAVIAAVLDVAPAPRLEVRLSTEVKAPVTKGQKLGTVKVIQAGRILGETPLIASADVPKPKWYQSVWFWAVRLWRGLTGSGGGL